MGNKNYRINKEQELLSSIINEEFPIVVFGSSGTGKTFTIENVLKKLNLSHKIIELSGTAIHRPINNKLISVVYLYDQKDLELIKFRKNLIVETCIPWANKFEGFKSIKLTKTKQEQKRGLKNLSLSTNLRNETQIEFFQFIGRIFYKKMKINEVKIENNYILYTTTKKRNESNKDEFCMNRKYSFEGSSNEVQMKNRRFHFIESSSIDQSQDVTKRSQFLESSNIDEVPIKNRKYIVEESSTNHFQNSNKRTHSQFNDFSDKNSSISFDEEMIFSSTEEESESVNRAIVTLKKLVSQEENQNDFNISFPLTKIENFLYRNFIYFLNLEDLQRTYNCLSLSDGNEKYFIAFVHCLLKNENSIEKKFLSFLPAEKLDKPNRKKGNDWRYEEFSIKLKM